MRKFVCTEICFHNLIYFEKGRVVEFEDFEWPLGKKGEIRHFVPLDGLPVPLAPVEEKPDPDVHIPVEDASSPDVPTCDICGKKVRTAQALAMHKKTQHKWGVPVEK